MRYQRYKQYQSAPMRTTSKTIRETAQQLYWYEQWNSIGIYFALKCAYNNVVGMRTSHGTWALMCVTHFTAHLQNARTKLVQFTCNTITLSNTSIYQPNAYTKNKQTLANTQNTCNQSAFKWIRFNLFEPRVSQKMSHMHTRSRNFHKAQNIHTTTASTQTHQHRAHTECIP